MTVFLRSAKEQKQCAIINRDNADKERLESLKAYINALADSGVFEYLSMEDRDCRIINKNKKFFENGGYVVDVGLLSDNSIRHIRISWE